MNISTKQKQTHRHRNRLEVGRVGWGDGEGVWGQQMQTIIYRMDKQQGPPVEHPELYSTSCDKP